MDTQPGHGATFRIFLPAYPLGAAASAAAAAARPKPRGGRETILLAEDESVVRKLICAILERHGYRVLTASNGVKALHVWREQRRTINLLLTDLVMPGGVNGLELARAVQAEEPRLKVVFISGYSAEVAGREMELRTGENFVQKPFVAGQLLETIRRCLDA